MSVTYLDFESDIKELEEQLEKTRAIQEKGKVDVTKTIADLEESLAKRTQEIYANLNPWQRVLVSRHPQRPYTLAHINALTDNTFVELHGDRSVRDDKAMVAVSAPLTGKPSC